MRWLTPPYEDARLPTISYKFRYREVGASSWHNIPRTIDDLSVKQEIGDLTNRHHYDMQVAAVNHVGAGVWTSIKTTPQAPYSPLPAPTGDTEFNLGTLGLYWENSNTGNTLWADTCSGSRSFYIIWNGPEGDDRAADEWAAHINTSKGAGVVDYSFRETPGSLATTKCTAR